MRIQAANGQFEQVGLYLKCKLRVKNQEADVFFLPKSFEFNPLA